MAIQTAKPPPSSLRGQVGDLIRLQREQARLTQADLGERAGKSVELIGKIERGETAPSFDTLDALSRALSVPVAHFFEVGGFRAGDDNSRLAQLVHRLAGLDADDLEWADELLKVALKRKVRASAKA